MPAAEKKAGSAKLVLLALVLATFCRCAKSEPLAPPEEPAPEPALAWDPASLGTDRKTTLRALVARQQDLQRSLGAHALEARSTLVTQVPGRAPQQLEQQLTLRQDATGQFAASKLTAPQHGHEVIWQGGAFYSRQRHRKFVKRQPRPGEPTAVADRLAGLLPAYVRLLGRFIAVKRAGEETLHGRQVVKISLSLAASPLPAAKPRSLAKSWRRSLTVTKLEGQALLDRQTGVPLQVRLEARWTFLPPPPGPLPPTGIPQGTGKTTATTVLSFQQTITALGQVAEITPPPADETVELPLRQRLEIERQQLTGELPLEDEETPSTNEDTDE